MNVSISPELERFVKGLVETGRFNSASEVVREGLRLVERQERFRLLEKALLEGLSPEEEARLPPDLLSETMQHFRQQIQVGLDQAERGELIDGEAFFAQLRDRTVRDRKPEEPVHTE